MPEEENKTAYDVSTPIGMVRLLISDIGGEDGTSFIYTDPEIQAFLNMKGSVEKAAVQALRTIAANTAMVLKTIKFMELTTNGAETAKALLLAADKIEEAIGNDEEYVDIVNVVDTCIGYELEEDVI